MARACLVLSCRRRWWVKPALYALAVAQIAAGHELPRAVALVARHGFRIQVESKQ